MSKTKETVEYRSKELELVEAVSLDSFASLLEADEHRDVFRRQLVWVAQGDVQVPVQYFESSWIGGKGKRIPRTFTLTLRSYAPYLSEKELMAFWEHLKTDECSAYLPVQDYAVKVDAKVLSCDARQYYVMLVEKSNHKKVKPNVRLARQWLHILSMLENR